MTGDPIDFPEAGSGFPVLVVAHPDDEALWFSSVLERVRRIVVCFLAHEDYPELAAARRASLAEHPLRDRLVCLGIDESGSFSQADWSNPAECEIGLELNSEAVTIAYRDRAGAIRRALPSLLADATAVFTHNPWGEYGHEDHVQVSRLVTDLATAHNIPVWYSTYASEKSLTLLRRYMGTGGSHYQLLRSEPALGNSIADVYRRHGAWTWFDDFRWFDHDCFIPGPLAPAASPDAGWLAPINLMQTQKEPQTPAAPNLMQRVRRRWSRAKGRPNGRQD